MEQQVLGCRDFQKAQELLSSDDEEGEDDLFGSPKGSPTRQKSPSKRNRIYEMQLKRALGTPSKISEPSHTLDSRQNSARRSKDFIIKQSSRTSSLSRAKTNQSNSQLLEKKELEAKKKVLSGATGSNTAKAAHLSKQNEFLRGLMDKGHASKADLDLVQGAEEMKDLSQVSFYKNGKIRRQSNSRVISREMILPPDQQNQAKGNQVKFNEPPKELNRAKSIQDNASQKSRDMSVGGSSVSSTEVDFEETSKMIESISKKIKGQDETPKAPVRASTAKSRKSEDPMNETFFIDFMQSTEERIEREQQQEKILQKLKMLSQRTKAPINPLLKNDLTPNSPQKPKGILKSKALRPPPPVEERKGPEEAV